MLFEEKHKQLSAKHPTTVFHVARLLDAFQRRRGAMKRIMLQLGESRSNNLTMTFGHKLEQLMFLLKATGSIFVYSNCFVLEIVLKLL